MHAGLTDVVGLVRDDLQVAQPVGTNMLAARARVIPGRVRELGRDVLHGGVNRVFAIARSHYRNINLRVLSLGYPTGYIDVQLDDLEPKVTPLSRDLSDRIEDLVLPHTG